MHRSPTTSRRALGFGVIGSLLVTSRTSASQGVSPFGDATPVATPVAGGSGQGWRVGDAQVLEVEGTICALSPDGQWLAGLGPDREFCIWSTDDLTPTLVPFHEPIDPDSIAWSPDSTAVAFSLQAFLQGIDGDIFVYELADETIHNLTDDGVEGGFFSADDAKPFPIDVMPAWTPDSSAIVFARSVWADVDEIPTDIARIPRGGGEVEVLVSVPARPFSIFTPMRVLADGTIVYTFAFNDVDDAQNGIWTCDVDGTTTLLVPGTSEDPFPTPVVLDAWAGDGELRLAGISASLSNSREFRRPWLFTWSSDVGDPEPVVQVDPSGPTLPVTAFWSPDGGTLLVIGWLIEEGGGMTVETIGPASEVMPLPESTNSSSQAPRWVRPTWSARQTVLLTAVRGGPYLLTMEPVEGAS